MFPEPTELRLIGYLTESTWTQKSQSNTLIPKNQLADILNNFLISVAYVPHLEKVYSNLRQKIGRKSEDDMKDLYANSLIWGMFMSPTLDAAVHLGKDYLENLHSIKNQAQRTIRQVFDVSQQLITDQTEIQGGARGMGSPRHAPNKRRRTREDPEPACVQTLWTSGGARRRGRANQRPAVVPSCRRGKYLQWDAKEGRTGLPARVSGRHVVRGWQSSPTLNAPR